MNVGEALNFVFEDEQWVNKIVLGALITLIPIFGQLVLLGYAVALIRNVEGGSPRLPTWDNLGDYFVEGLMFWIVTLIYSIPLLIFICPIALAWIPPAVAGDNGELATALAGVSGIISAGLGCLATLYGILLWVLTPVLQIRYAETGKIADCLRFGDVFRYLFDNIGDLIIAQLLVAVVGIVVTSVLGGVIAVVNIVPICGQIIGFVLSLLAVPVGVWIMLFSAHLYGQIGRRAGASAYSM